MTIHRYWYRLIQIGKLEFGSSRGCPRQVCWKLCRVTRKVDPKGSLQAQAHKENVGSTLLSSNEGDSACFCLLQRTYGLLLTPLSRYTDLQVLRMGAPGNLDTPYEEDLSGCFLPDNSSDHQT